jgi:hypothetical protein
MSFRSPQTYYADFPRRLQPHRGRESASNLPNTRAARVVDRFRIRKFDLKTDDSVVKQLAARTMIYKGEHCYDDPRLTEIVAAYQSHSSAQGGINDNL